MAIRKNSDPVRSEWPEEPDTRLKWSLNRGHMAATVESEDRIVGVIRSSSIGKSQKGLEVELGEFICFVVYESCEICICSYQTPLHSTDTG